MPKEYVYAPIPEFDQETQYVSQMAPVDMGDHYFVGVEVHGIDQTDPVPEQVEEPVPETTEEPPVETTEAPVTEV